MSIPVGSNNIHLKNTYINFTAKATYTIYLLIVFLIINAKMSKVTKNGFSHFRRGFEAFHKSRYPTDFEKISHIYAFRERQTQTDRQSLFEALCMGPAKGY